MKKKTAIEFYGSVSAVAAALEISQAAVSQWGEDVPEGSAYKLESITGGRLKAQEESPREKKRA